MSFKFLKIKLKKFLSNNPKLDIIVKKLLCEVFTVFFKIKFGKLDFYENQIVFECFKGKFVNDSPFALFQCLVNKNNKYSFIWVLEYAHHPLEIVLNEFPNTKVVYYGTKEYFEAYAKSKYWITNCRLPYRIAKKKGQIYIQCWHGTPLKRMAHDITIGDNAKTSLDGLKYAYSHEVKRLDFFISPSEYASNRFCSSFNMPHRKILEVGYPRNDKLILEKNNLELINNIKKSLKINPSKKVILYAPTWRDNKISNDGKHVLTNVLESKEFVKSFDKNDVVFLYRGHYFTRLEGGVSEFFDVSNYNDLNDLLLISDALITDYSSLFFDYANLCRPIYFYMPDLNEYMNKIRGFYLDINNDLPGPIASTPEELANLMKIDFDKSIFEGFNKKYNSYEDGCSSSRVIGSIGI